MLVLSRRLKEKIVFPDIDTAVQVLTVRGNVVRLGIDAPPDVVVLREEVPEDPGVRPDDAGEVRHALRNRLNAAAVSLALLRCQLRAGDPEAAEKTLDTLEQELQNLRRQVEGGLGTRPNRPKPAQTARPRRALLVEDDHNERELLAGLLRMAGMDVVTADDGGDALTSLQKGDRPDVILMDLGLPRCDGLTAIREVRREPRWRDVKIIAVTGQEPNRLGIDPAEAGIDRWFHKLLDPQALLRDLNLVPTY